MTDLDQGGMAWQKARVYLGPTLGWVETQVRPTRNITTGGTTTLAAGDSVVLVNVALAVTINLPDVAQWLKEVAYQPATAFERAIWVKDIGGHAAVNNITITPFGTQTIDNSLASVVINTNLGFSRLYPLNDLSGWFVG